MSRVLFRTFAVVAVGSAAWFVSPAFAESAGQTPPAEQAPAGRERVGLEKLRPVMQAIEKLDLTPEQRGKLRAVMQQARKDFEALRKDLESMDGKQAKGVVEEFLNGVRDKVEAILTADQRSKLEAELKAMRDEQADRRKQKGLEASSNPQSPTTKPADADKDMPRRAFAGPIQRFADALAAMEMTGEQRDKVNAILAEAKDAFEKLRGESDDPDPQQLREKARELMIQTRDKLAGVLSAEQMQKLQESIGQPGVRDGGRPERPNRPNRPDRRDPPSNRREPAPTTKPAEAPAPRTEASATLGVGDLVAEFSLTRLDGKPFSSRLLAGKPAVIVFGSYSSPTFRDRIAAIDSLAKQYGKRATFVVVYTKEMHPAGEWEPQRNVDDNVSVAAHKSNDDRFAAARAARDKLKLANIEIVPEPVGEPVSRQFAAEPTGAIVIDAKGVIVAKQRFAEAGAIDVHLADLAKE